MRILLADDHAVVRRGLKQILADDFKKAEFGVRVFCALNANNDALLVPLSDNYAAELRAVRPASDPR